MGAPSQIRNAGPLNQPEYLCDRNQCFHLDVTECFGCHVALLCQELMEFPSLALISLLASREPPIPKETEVCGKAAVLRRKTQNQDGLPSYLCDQRILTPTPRASLSSSVWCICVMHLCEKMSVLSAVYGCSEFLWFCDLTLKRSYTSHTTFLFFSQINLTIQTMPLLKVNNNVF